MPKAIEDLHNTIIREARPILLEHGYEQLTIRNVARICDVAVGTVYRYFDSKDALVSEIMHGDWDPALERMRDFVETVSSPLEGLQMITDCIRDFIKLYANAWMEYRMLYRSSDALFRQHNSFIRDVSSVIHPMMLRFQPDYNPILSQFLSQTVFLASAERDLAFETMKPIYAKLTE